MPAWLTDSGLAYGVVGLSMSLLGIAIGILFGTPTSQRVLDRYDGEYFSGRRQMFEMNLRMKEEGSS